MSLARNRATSRSSDLLRQIGSKIRFLRNHRYAGRRTQAQVARAANLSVSFLSMVERGARSPSMETLADIARALGVPLSEVFHFDEDLHAVDPAFHKLVSFARERGLARSEIDHLLEVAKAMFPAAAERDTTHQ